MAVWNTVVDNKVIADTNYVTGSTKVYEPLAGQ